MGDIDRFSLGTYGYHHIHKVLIKRASALKTLSSLLKFIKKVPLTIMVCVISSFGANGKFGEHEIVGIRVCQEQLLLFEMCSLNFSSASYCNSIVHN